MAETRSDAQARVDDIHAFRRELGQLAQEGVGELSSAQRGAIDAYHDAILAGLARTFDIDRDARARQLSLGMKVASFLGAVALAAAIFFLFYRFWGLVPTAAQVAILLGASLGSLGLTELVRRRDASGYFCKLTALVAFVCFVLNIAMFGQIFNITPSDKALLPWAAYAFLLAYRCDLRLLQVAGILCLATFIAARAGTFGGMYWLGFGERPENFFPAALVLFFIPRAFDHRRYTGFAATYRIFGVLAVLLPMLLLANWGSISFLGWPATRIEALYQVFGFVCSAGFIALGIRRGWQGVANAGVVFFVIFLYTKFYDWWWQTMPKYLFFLVIALSAVLLLLVFQRLRRVGERAPGAGA